MKRTIQITGALLLAMSFSTAAFAKKGALKPVHSGKAHKTTVNKAKKSVADASQRWGAKQSLTSRSQTLNQKVIKDAIQKLNRVDTLTYSAEVAVAKDILLPSSGATPAQQMMLASRLNSVRSLSGKSVYDILATKNDGTSRDVKDIIEGCKKL